jgi:glutamate dehydrogenase/leucine dehydrogenase
LDDWIAGSGPTGDNRILSTDTIRLQMKATDSPFFPNHEEVITVWHRRSGLHAAIAIHSTVRGPSLGGSRFRAYPSLDAAVAEVCNLAEAMTYKAAVAGLPFGGGKAVLIGDPAVTKTDELLADYASVLNDLSGRYITAEDVGATMADMDRLREHTPFVAGTSVDKGGSGDPSPMTAIGIRSAMEAGSAHVWGTRDLAGRHIAISGIGKVGSSLARLLLERGCRLTLADTSERAQDKVEALVTLGEVNMVDPGEIHRVDCDIFSPCALGGVLNDRSIAELKCQMVIGAANNQLSGPEVADALQELGITYVPDFVANAGGIINIAHEYLGYDEAKARAHVEQIFTTTEDIFNRSAEGGVTPLGAAMELALERLTEAGSAA